MYVYIIYLYTYFYLPLTSLNIARHFILLRFNPHALC